MNYWLFAEPVGNTDESVWKIYSDTAIISEYWDDWMQKGLAFNKAHGLKPYEGVTKERCIDDWVVVHWAIPAKPEYLLKIIQAPKST